MTYTYDVFGNRKTMTDEKGVTAEYNYNAANEVEDVNGVICEHDKNGNLTLNGRLKFVYNADNRLQTVQDDSGTELGKYGLLTGTPKDKYPKYSVYFITEPLLLIKLLKRTKAGHPTGTGES
jgi:hypothetical protein